MRLFQAHAYCSICRKLVIGEECSEHAETEAFMQHFHMTEFLHFVDGEAQIVEVKKPPLVLAPREPQGGIKPLKKKKADRYG